MFKKGIQIVITALIAFSAISCSSDSNTEALLGTYSVTLNCSALSMTRHIDNVVVMGINNDRIEIILGSTLESMTGSVNELEELTMDPYKGTLPDGTVLFLPTGHGEFIRYTKESNELVKFMNIYFENEYQMEGACNLQLIGKI